MPNPLTFFVSTTAEPGKHRAGLVKVERLTHFLPSHEVGAHRMAPMHVAPIPAIRIVLEKQVILAAIEDEAVRIVGPAPFGRKVELRNAAPPGRDRRPL